MKHCPAREQKQRGLACTAHLAVSCVWESSGRKVKYHFEHWGCLQVKSGGWWVHTSLSVTTCCRPEHWCMFPPLPRPHIHLNVRLQARHTQHREVMVLVLLLLLPPCPQPPAPFSFCPSKTNSQEHPDRQRGGTC